MISKLGLKKIAAIRRKVEAASRLLGVDIDLDFWTTQLAMDDTFSYGHFNQFEKYVHGMAGEAWFSHHKVVVEYSNGADPGWATAGPYTREIGYGTWYNQGKDGWMSVIHSVRVDGVDKEIPEFWGLVKDAFTEAGLMRAGVPVPTGISHEDWMQLVPHAC